jgi:hypothetical protein
MEYQIYPGSTPEFKMVQDELGREKMHVRYINAKVGYTGKWMPVAHETSPPVLTAEQKLAKAGLTVAELKDLLYMPR